MKVIRRNIFETNSSSTHSISIYKWTPTKESPIPSDSDIDIEGEVSAQTEIKDEMGKLKYIICMLASIAEQNEDDFSEEYDDNYISNNNKEKYFKKLINSKHFIWLKEVIKDVKNTNINYSIPDSDYFPYYETVYDNNRSIKSVLGCDINDETSFKKRITEIIFDENIIIEDKENEY